MAITSGTHYFGPSESLINLSAVAGQINSQVLTGDITFVQTGNVSANGTTTFSSVNLGSYTLRFTSQIPLLGDPTRGYWIDVGNNGASTSFLFSSISMAGGKLEMDNLSFITSGTYLFWLETGSYFLTHDCIFRKYGNVGSGSVYTVAQNANLSIFNTKTYANLINFSILTPTTFAPNMSAYIENNTYFGPSPALGFTNATQVNTRKVIKNNLFYCTDTTNLSIVGLSNVSAISNATSDAVVSGDTLSFTNIVAMNHFATSSVSDSDFLNLKSTSYLISAGTTPTISSNVLGIRANLRPGDNYYSIGADEYGPLIVKFVVDKTSGTIPFYFRLTDLSELSFYTSATEYSRLWSITNLRTNSIEYFTTTSASINYCISADSLLNDAYSVSLSAMV